MIKPIYSVRDQKQQEYLHPICTTNESTAIREFYSTLEQVPLMRTHPKDFDLYHIGQHDTETGIITPNLAVQFIISGLDCIKHIQEPTQDETSKVGDESPVQPST